MTLPALNPNRNANPFLHPSKAAAGGDLWYIGHAQASIRPFDREFSRTIWEMKYRYATDETIDDTMLRIAKGVFAKEDPENYEWAQWAFWALQAGLLMPGGRISATAGTPKHTTMINCYVSTTIEDSLVGIMKAHTEAALTLQMGGGIGMDFSTLRPKRAELARTGEGSEASGIGPFMDMWDAMCRTIMSAGARRGAMMGTLCDTHPDLLEFITAKTVKGRWTNFNVSVLVSDAFMAAVDEDADWLLYFKKRPTGERDPKVAAFDFVDDEGVQQYVYSVWKARDLWNRITELTHQYSEPGVIFIDRINELNNNAAFEDIRCTNPCGEQPLPPYACCNLSAINLARMVLDPYSDTPSMNWKVLERVVEIGVWFLDNVIDTTLYPLPEQAQEEHDKRRIGLGFSGLADCLAQLNLRYGSPQAAEMASKIMQRIMYVAYRTSIDIAKIKGPFPAFKEGYLIPGTFVAERVPADLQQAIRAHGIRNSLLLTVAPVGTGSILFGDTSSGLEPTFAHRAIRKVLQNDGTWKEHETLGYGLYMLQHIKGTQEPLPHMVTSEDLKVHEHIVMQSAIQRYVDASVSKTINCPEDISLDDFRNVYDLAYKSGLKGCTTYRPSDIRGAVLSKATNSSNAQTPAVTELRPRPDVLSGKTYKIKWPHKDAAMYMTINSDEDSRPFEILITSKDASHQEWITALTLMITAIFRKGGDISFIANELKQVNSFHDTAWIGGKHYGSIPAYIGHILEAHLTGNSTQGAQTGTREPARTDNSRGDAQPARGSTCPKCSAPTLIRAEGCKKCTSCGFSSCG
jgi:ribonucleoside-diphosphate reductase alpha chain